MRNYFLVLLLLILSLPACSAEAPDTRQMPPAQKVVLAEQQRIDLPQPRQDSDYSLEQSLQSRRSIRKYSNDPITLADISQLLWAAQGITEGKDRRTAPSAGALYPLEVYLVAGNAENLAAGVYRYDAKNNQLLTIKHGDLRPQLATAALNQSPVKEGGITLVFTAVSARTTKKYGNRGLRYVLMEVGHAGQNVCLQATALGLGAVPIGAFDNKSISTLLNLPKEEEPHYLIPVGNLREQKRRR